MLSYHKIMKGYKAARNCWDLTLPFLFSHPQGIWDASQVSCLLPQVFRETARKSQIKSDFRSPWVFEIPETTCGHTLDGPSQGLPERPH